MPRPDLDRLVRGVREGDRGMLGRAITLVESSRTDDRQLAESMLAALLPHSGEAVRVGISGVPGVGKSTFIERFGRQLTGAGHRVAVLAVDPSSSRTGGSILGDKTRMTELARDPAAFIRPSPSSGTLGGVARRTRETIVLVEAAGYDVVLVETVGVGQSEAMVANMVDFFLVLMLPSGGDELQGIKRGILELADLIAVNKADGELVQAAERARQDYTRALALLPPTSPNWTPKVLTCSARDGAGLDAVWVAIGEHRHALQASGELQARRAEQRVHWMWQALESGLMSALRSHAPAAALLQRLGQDVRAGTLPPEGAARKVLARFLEG